MFHCFIIINQSKFLVIKAVFIVFSFVILWSASIQSFSMPTIRLAKHISRSASIPVRSLMSVYPSIQMRTCSRLFSEKGFGSTSQIRPSNIKIINSKIEENSERNRQIQYQQLVQKYSKGPNDATNSSSPAKGSVFTDLLVYPTKFTIKVIGHNDTNFLSDVLNIVQQASATNLVPSTLSPIGNGVESSTTLDRENRVEMTYSTKLTENQKFLSVTLTGIFLSAEELYAVYKALGQHPKVKFTI
jgi:putative lipoic acid-binding regulatory protein